MGTSAFATAGIFFLGSVAIPFGTWLVRTLNTHSLKIESYGFEISELKKDSAGLQSDVGGMGRTLATVAEGIEWIKSELRGRKG